MKIGKLYKVIWPNGVGFLPRDTLIPVNNIFIIIDIKELKPSFDIFDNNSKFSFSKDITICYKTKILHRALNEKLFDDWFQEL